MTQAGRDVCRWIGMLAVTGWMFLAAIPPAFAQGPLAVSPQGGAQEAVIASECPTFSWSDHAGAVAFHLEVYDRGIEPLQSHDELATLAPPVLTQTIPAPAFTWTPSLPTCLTAGGRYLWYVQAVDADGQGAWSAPAAFTVQAGLSAVLQTAVEEAVERALTASQATTSSASTGTTSSTSGPGTSPSLVGATTTTRTGSTAPAAFEGSLNTFYGAWAGNSTSGDNDGATFIGAWAGGNNSSGYNNTFVGYLAGLSNHFGYANTFVGESAGLNTTGNSNTFVGQRAGAANTTATYNTFVGREAGTANTTGTYNTFVGRLAGATNTEAWFNTFVGEQAGFSTTTGAANTFLGRAAGYTNSTGFDNVFLGNEAGFSNTTATYNTFLGASAGYNNTTGGNNTFVGRSAGAFNTTGATNTFVGNDAGYNNTTGYANTFLGTVAGGSTTTGNSNTVLGNWAGATNITGSGNVFLGDQAGYYETGSNRLYIDNSSTATPLLYGQFDTDKLTVNGNLTVIGPDNGLLRLSNVTTDATTKVSRMVLTHYTTAQLPVYLFGAASTATNNFVALGGGNAMGNAATQLDFFTATTPTTPIGTPRLTIKGDGAVGIGTQTPTQPLQMAGGAYSDGTSWYTASSRSLKDDITPLPLTEARETIQALAPVTFRYTSAPERLHAGFIAEDVPTLVAASERKGLSPLEIVAVLTRVVQEQQRENEEQQRKNEVQQKEIETQQREVEAQHKELEGYRVALAEQQQQLAALQAQQQILASQQHLIHALAGRLQALEQGRPRHDAIVQAR